MNNTIEEKLDELAECGFKLGDEFSIADLVSSWGRDALDRPGFDLALVCLGMAQENPPWAPHCDTLWHFDTECIEGDGSYVRIARRMTDMAKGSLPLSAFEDHVDIEKGNAWLRFKCDDAQMQIDCVVDDDWVDTKVLAHFVDLLARYDPHKLFIYCDLGGQDCIIGCTTRGQFERLRKIFPTVQPLK